VLGLLERKLLEHDAGEADASQQRDRRASQDDRQHTSYHMSRTEEWVMMHRAIQMEYAHRPEMEGSLGSGTGSYDGDTFFHINPDDSASNDGAFQRVAVGSHRDLENGAEGKGISGLERMLDVSKRICTAGSRSKADKVARSPWKTSVDVNP
jgi:hypothetical protein